MAILAAKGANSDAAMGAPVLVAFINDARSEETIKALVQEQLMTFTVVRRGNCRDAIAFMKNSASPRMLIVDISKSEIPLTEVDELINMCDPSVTVLVIGEENDIGVYRDLTLIGVSDYIVKPLTPEILRRTISIRMGGKQASHTRHRAGKVICVTGARGGVGTTTFCANLAHMMSEESGRRVALVDLDLQCGSLPMMLGLKSTVGFMEALRNPHRVDNLFIDRTLIRKSDKLFVLSAEEPLDDTTAFDPASLDVIFQTLSQRFHYVILDLPRHPGELYRRVLEHAAVRVILANGTLTSIRDTIRITRMIGREDLGQRAYVLLNHTTPHGRAEISRLDFEKAVGRRIDFEIPYARAGLFTDNSGQMLCVHDGGYAAALRQFTNDLSGRPQQTHSMIQRLFNRR
ncbi:MAG: AAA family ATPase [Azospirillaceae bacterium]|nr:AAA family ATPase [Azospirillaceae bacterium]